jgi:hypothetical protein
MIVTMYCVTRSILNNLKQADPSFLSHLNCALTFIGSRQPEGFQNEWNTSPIICAYGVNSLGRDKQATVNVLQKFNFNFMNLFTYGDNSIRSAFACAVNNKVQQRQSC